MNKNLILEIKPEYNIQSRLTHFSLKGGNLFDIKIVYIGIAIFSLIFAGILILIFPSFFQNLKRNSLECTLITFIIAFSPFIIVHVSAILKYLIIEKKNFNNYSFKIYEDGIEFVGAPSYLKRTMLNFSDIDEIIFTQNSIQKKNNLISVEFISSKEQNNYPLYNHFHENIIFFDVPNTQELHDILNRKFDED